MNKKLATGTQVLLGFLLGVVLNIVFTRAWFMLGMTVLPRSQEWEDIMLYSIGFLGVVQLIWQVPVTLLLRRKGHKVLALGVILVASLVILLNATCWVLLETGKIR